MYRHTNKQYHTKERRTTFKQRLGLGQKRNITFQEQINSAPNITKEMIYHRENIRSCFILKDLSQLIQSYVTDYLHKDALDDTTPIIFVPITPSFPYIVFFLDENDEANEIVHVLSSEFTENTLPIPMFKTIDQIPLIWKTEETDAMDKSSIYLVCDAKQLHSPNILITVNEMGKICHVEYVLSDH